MTVAIAERLHRRASGWKDADWPFLSVAAVLFTASATATILWCIDMPAICGMSMPGGWTMSMTWMRMPGQSWPEAAISFLAMWTVMMVAMMLPSLMPMLWRYRQAIDGAAVGVARVSHLSEMRLGLLTALAGLGYFTVWAAIGLAVYPPGVALAATAMELPVVSRAVPLGAAAIVLAAGLLQFTAWKARRLACCRALPTFVAMPDCCASEQDRTLRVESASAWLYGLRLGFHCTTCCVGPMAVLLALGVMDLRAMAVVTAAITLERLAPAGRHVARITGLLAIAAGALLIAQALALA